MPNKKWIVIIIALGLICISVSFLGGVRYGVSITVDAVKETMLFLQADFTEEQWNKMYPNSEISYEEYKTLDKIKECIRNNDGD